MISYWILCIQILGIRRRQMEHQSVGLRDGFPVPVTARLENTPASCI